MYFKNCNVQGAKTQEGKAFIKELSGLLNKINPCLVDKEKINITVTEEKDDEIISVFIPHKSQGILNLIIEFDSAETTIHFVNGEFHFQDYDDDELRIEDTINLVTKIMKSVIEIHTYFKGVKVVKIQPYFVNEFEELEPFQRSYYNFISLFNPLLRTRKTVERGSFFG